MRPKYEQYSTLFHTRAEVEGLYQTLSEFAEMNGLVISRIEKNKAESVSKDQALNKDSKKKVKKDKKNIKAYVLLGDGECNEGSIWEAAMAAPNFKLNNLYVIIDKNNFQQTGIFRGRWG